MIDNTVKTFKQSCYSVIRDCQYPINQAVYKFNSRSNYNFNIPIVLFSESQKWFLRPEKERKRKCRQTANTIRAQRNERLRHHEFEPDLQD